MREFYFSLLSASVCVKIQINVVFYFDVYMKTNINVSKKKIKNLKI